MAAMGIRSLKFPSDRGEDALTAAGHYAPNAGVLQFGTAITVIGVLCAPANPVSGSPIMPEGFITYTDLMPSREL